MSGIVVVETGSREVSAYRLVDLASVESMSVLDFLLACDVCDDLLIDAALQVDPVARMEGEPGVALSAVVNNMLLQYPGAVRIASLLLHSHPVIRNFQLSFFALKMEHAALIKELENSLEPNAIDDLYWDSVSDLKGRLASEAANQCTDDADAQEESIFMVEQWISKNSPESVATILFVNGMDNGLKNILSLQENS